MGIGSWGWWGFEGLRVWGEADGEEDLIVWCCCSLVFDGVVGSSTPWF